MFFSNSSIVKSLAEFLTLKKYDLSPPPRASRACLQKLHCAAFGSTFTYLRKSERIAITMARK